MSKRELIERNALHGKNIALSVSESRDFRRLGLTEKHSRLAVAEIARSVFLADGSITYGGHLRDGGYTQILMDEVLRYGDNHERAREEFKALTLCVPLSEHRRISLENLRSIHKRINRSARLQLMDADGQPMMVPEVTPARRGVTTTPDPVASLSAMRRHVTQSTQARVLIGGKLSGYQGKMPGIIEEALLSMEQGRPLYVVASYGGAAAAVARTIGIDDLAWAPPGFPAGVEDPSVVAALAQLKELESSTSRENGLTVPERQQLSASHRPGTIAAFIVQGLARLAA